MCDKLKEEFPSDYLGFAGWLTWNYAPTRKNDDTPTCSRARCKIRRLLAETVGGSVYRFWCNHVEYLSFEEFLRFMNGETECVCMCLESWDDGLKVGGGGCYNTPCPQNIKGVARVPD